MQFQVSPEMNDTGKFDSVQKLRMLLLDGRHAPGDRIGETEMAEALDVSRTLVRIAMTALEEEGLLIRRPNRGCILRGYTVSEVCDAIEVRGELEGMAARKAAETGLSESLREVLCRNLDQGDRLSDAGLDTPAKQAAWLKMNAEFHRVIVAGAQIGALTNCIDRLRAIPLAAAEAVLLHKGDARAGAAQLVRSQQDHRAVFEAICDGAGHRAESLMREHAHRSAANKRANLKDAATRAAYRALPGLRLVLDDPGGAQPPAATPGHKFPEGD